MQVQAEFTSRELRNTLGRFATGIAVVAARVDGEVLGMTINSFTSVSLEPPLVLFCLGRNTHFFGQLERANAFALSFLGNDQEAHSRLFAGQKGAEALGGPFFPAEGPPLLLGATGGLDCHIESKLEAGDHVIVVGRVRGIWQAESNAGPLLYFMGRYAQGPVPL